MEARSSPPGSDRVAATQPVGLSRKRVKKPPVLFERTQPLIERIERLLSRTFVTYWMTPSSSVSAADVEAFHRILRILGRRKELVLFVKSDGGNGRAALRMVHLLRQFSPRLTVLVPLECASAATMLALGADEIHMGPTAYLSAVDTSLTHDLSPIDKDNRRVSVGQDEVARILRNWKAAARRGSSNPYQTLFQYVHPLVIGAVDRASSLSIMLCKEILSYHMKDSGKAERISRRLNSDYPSHSYPITIREAARIGIKVRPLDPDVHDSLIELNGIYSEMGQTAVTDYDERSHHDHEIMSILETRNLMVYYQINKDWHYRTEERRWVSLHDESSWHHVERKGRKVTDSVFHIR